MDERIFLRLCCARERLQQPTEEPLTIRDVAHSSGVSVFHFIRRFEALFGDTPRQFKIKTQIDKARELLATTDRSVTDICFDVGFTSLGSFSALFARRVGQSPTAFRAAVRLLPAREPEGCLTLIGRLPADAAIFEKP